MPLQCSHLTKVGILSVVERELHADAQVCATALTGLGATCAGSAAESSKTAAEASSEDVAELSEDVVHAHAAAFVEAASAATAEALRTHRVAVTVVFLTLLLIAEDIVGLGSLLELLLGGLVAGVLVRVVFDGQLAVSFLDLVSRGCLAHPKDLVVISFFCHISFLLLCEKREGRSQTHSPTTTLA